MKKNIKVGLVGENPSDTQAIENLLSKDYTEVKFIHLLKGAITGSMLDNMMMLKALRIEVESHKPDIVLFIRDLDGLKSDKDFAEKNEKRQNFYTKGKRMVNFQKEIREEDSLFLLNIYELEALILADIGNCNAYFGKNLALDKPAMEYEQPKEWLKINCKYHVGEISTIFAALNAKNIQANCEYFDAFLQKWEKYLAFHLK